MAINTPGSMEVVAVSQALPQWLEMRGRRVHTSIIHTPLTKPTQSILVQPSQGIDGNSSAAHNAEVYIFFAHHYEYWTKKLSIPREAWDWCHWGENITFRCERDITEADFHLGDIWKIGEDVVLQVCGSRVPCFKLAWRCGQKDSWLQDLAATGKCGVYLKVLKGGRIYPGDVAILQSKRSQGPVVDCATITRVAFADALSTRNIMDLLVDHPDLLDMNKLIFRRKLSMLHDQALVGKGAWKGWRRVCVSRAVDETSSIKSFYLVAIQDPDVDKPLAAFLPGQFVTVRLPNGLIRCWSLSTYPDESQRETPESYRVSIRKTGVASSWMHDTCLPGTILEIQAPAGAFCLDWSPQFPGRQAFVSAGIGITPMMAMFREHLQHQAMQRAPAVWIHVSGDIESMPFREELKTLLESPAAQELGVQVMLFLTALSQLECDAFRTKITQAKDSSIYPSVHPGRPTLEALRSLFSEPYFMDPLKITPIEIEGRFSTVYLCGPAAFEEDMRSILTSLDVPDAMILSEAFSGWQPTAPSQIDEADVHFTRSKRTACWKNRGRKPHRGDRIGAHMGDRNEGEQDVSPDLGQSLLELAEKLGLAPESGCRTGVCGACERTLCKGKVTGGLQPGGIVRICVARPASESVEIDL